MKKMSKSKDPRTMLNIMIQTEKKGNLKKNTGQRQMVTVGNGSIFSGSGEGEWVKCSTRSLNLLNFPGLLCFIFFFFFENIFFMLAIQESMSYLQYPCKYSDNSKFMLGMFFRVRHCHVKIR